MTTLRISITAEVLEATKDCIGDMNVTENCALAYAIRKIWPKAEACWDYIFPFSSIEPTKIPHKHNWFIQEFDRATPSQRAAMQPFSFEIEVPDEVIGEVNIEEIRDIIKNSKTLELV